MKFNGTLLLSIIVLIIAIIEIVGSWFLGHAISGFFGFTGAVYWAVFLTIFLGILCPTVGRTVRTKVE